MLRALLDTNLLISAAIRPNGAPGQIVKAFFVREAFNLILSPAIVMEVEKTLRLPKIRKYLIDPDEALLWLDDLEALAVLVQDTGHVVGVCRDPADDAILAAAIEGRASVLVTGDNDLLTLVEYKGVDIITPGAFLTMIEG